MQRIIDLTDYFVKCIIPKAYDILTQNRITQLDGLTIPRIHRRDFDLHLIQIDFVSPPFLLDFAGVAFTDPGFPSETKAQMHRQIQARFGRNAGIAYSIQYQLLKIGIYYLDLRLSNLNLNGLSGAVPPFDEDVDEKDDW